MSGHLLFSLIIVLVCTWMVLTHKVPTNSLFILALAMVGIGSAIGAAEIIEHRACPSMSVLVIRGGLAFAGLLFFIRVEILPRITRKRQP